MNKIIISNDDCFNLITCLQFRKVEILKLLHNYKNEDWLKDKTLIDRLENERIKIQNIIKNISEQINN